MEKNPASRVGNAASEFLGVQASALGCFHGTASILADRDVYQCSLAAVGLPQDLPSALVSRVIKECVGCRQQLARFTSELSWSVTTPEMPSLRRNPKLHWTKSMAGGEKQMKAERSLELSCVI